MENKRFKIDIDEVLKAKVKKKLPKFLVNFLKRRIHQDEINDCIEKAEHPQGVGFFDEALNYLDIKYEACTPDYVGSCALATALDYISAIGMKEIADYEHELLAYATEKIKEIEGVRIIGEAKEKSGVLSFVVDGVHPYDIGMMLDKLGIAIRTGHHCAEPLVDWYGIPGTARASFAFYNTKAEIDYFISSLKRVLMILK